MFRELLRKSVLTGGVHLVIASPGSGKSWELTRLAEELAQEHIIVARHYCYLEPGDELVERRVTTDVLFGNLLAELYETLPDELGARRERFSADLESLEKALDSATTLEQPVVLIVDGLDHIARVRSSSRELSDDETDIVERLATLAIPEGVTLILGSQPGHHLDPFYDQQQQNIIKHDVPRWEKADAIQLAQLHGVGHAFAEASISDKAEVQELLELLAERSDGNPLYIRYLSNGIVSGLQAGTIVNPRDWLDTNPVIAGDIAVYYQHLYNNVTDQAQSIADLLGTVDFSVTEADLKEILPSLLSRWIPEALNALAPVLTSSTGQGGMRIFHESFRRFMLDELARQEQEISTVLEPVIQWLENCGFYPDAKSYRFLLPALRRAGRNSDILRYIDASFVSTSVSHGHPSEAIQKNLALAADVAGRRQDWPALVRCVELRRALSTCFDVGQNPWRDYWETYVDIYGPAAMAERLLLDGMPTQSRNDGLLSCMLVDDRGAIAPWREYLELPVSDESSDYSSNFGYGESPDENETLNLAVVQGRLRLGEEWRILRRACEYLYDQEEEPRVQFIRKLTAQLARIGKESVLLKLASRSNEGSSSKLKLNVLVGVALRLGVADELTKRGDKESASTIASTALVSANTPELAMACVELGAVPNVGAVAAVEPASIPIGLQPDEFIEDASNIRIWIASVRLLAATPECDEIIAREQQRIQGTGWFRCWLRFVLATSQAEAAHRAGKPYDINSVFDVLSEDVRPFEGRPRPCDLYRLHGVIKETLARSLQLIQTPDEWKFALGKIKAVNEGTSSRLDREDAGPVSTGMVVDLLSPYSADPVVGKDIRLAIQQQIENLDQTGSYYSTHASHAMRLAKIQMKAGQTKDALDNWNKACVYLTGYGWHKDITLFDLIESAPVLVAESQETALSSFQELQPLVDAAILHTDGRETKRCPNAWFRNLLQVAPSTAIELLARTFINDDGIENWPTVDALEDVANYLADKADPLLLDSLWETIRFKIEYDNSGPRHVEERLAPLNSLFSVHPDLASQRLVRLSAEVANDEIRRNETALECIENFATNHGQPPRVTVPKSNETQHILGSRDVHQGGPFTIKFRTPAFATNASFVELLVGLRKVANTTNTRPLHIRHLDRY